jgi:O-antigen/teichoic acid export membrane protein
MLSELKRLGTHTIIYGLTTVLSRSVTFLLLPIQTYLLGSPVEFGEVTIFAMFNAFVFVLFCLGFDTAFFRFYMLKETGYTNKNIFSTAFYAICAVSISLSFLIFYNAGIISDLLLPNRLLEAVENSDIVRWNAGILLFDALAILPFLVFRAENRPMLFMTLKIVNVILTVIGNIVFIPIWGKEGVFIANFVSSVITFLTVSPIVVNRLTIRLSKTVFIGLMKFGLPYIFPGISVVSLDLIDRLFIERMHGAGMAGIYSASYRISMIMSIIIAAFRFAWHPFFTSISQKVNAKEIYSRVLTYFVLIVGWIYLFISYFIYFFVKIKLPFIEKYLIREEYWSGLPIIPVVMLAYVFYGIYVNFIVGIYIKKQSQNLPLITITAAGVNIALNYLLIPPYTMMGAAVSTAVSYAVMAGIMYFVSQKIYPIVYEYKRLLLIVCMISILFFIPFFVPHWIKAPVKILLLIVYPFVLYSVGFYKNEELKFIRKRVYQFISFKK